MPDGFPPFDGKPCPACPQEVRELFAAAGQLLHAYELGNLAARTAYDASKFSVLRSKFDGLAPLVRVHFADRAHSHGDVPGVSQPVTDRHISDQSATAVTLRLEGITIEIARAA